MNTFHQALCLCVVICGVTNNIEGVIGYSDFTSQLQWAPLTLKKPYITFLNSFNYASWKTRNSVSKEAESLRYLQLPRDVPFAVGCGACFQHSSISVNVNLSISVTNHDYISVPRLLNGRQRQFRVGYLACVMTYAITAPILTNGQITCTLQRGRRQESERIYFNVRDVEVEEVHEEIQIHQDPENIRLHCPAPDQPLSADNPVIHVWHQDPLPIPVTADTHNSVIPHLQSSIPLYYRGSDTDIICSVYNIGYPTKVLQKRYTITGSWASQNQMYHAPSDAEDDNGEQKLSVTSIGVIVAAVAVCLIIIIMAAQHFISAIKKK